MDAILDLKHMSQLVQHDDHEPPFAIVNNVG
jgi:hypothetical protein